MLYLFTIDVILPNSIKYECSINDQITNLTFVGKNPRDTINGYSIA